MNLPQARALAQLIRTQRIEQHLSASEVARRARISKATVTRLEQQLIATPTASVLHAIGEVLDIPQSDMFAAAGWVPEGELPRLAIYLKAKYSDLPPEAVSDIERHFCHVAERYNIDFTGPRNQEDE